MAPTVVFVPGFWEGPKPFEKVSSLLQSAGFETQTAILPSTGSISPGNPGMLDDINAVRGVVEKLVDAGKEVLLVLHSAGGFIGSNAIEGLSAKVRSAKNLAGGVSKIVFISGAVFPKGFTHGPLPFGVVKDGALTCATPEKILFSDLDEAEATKWVGELKPQPGAGWDDTVTYCGWEEVPSVYLVCEGDQALPTPLQEQLAASANSKIERCSAGHIPMVSQPERVVEVIKGAAA